MAKQVMKKKLLKDMVIPAGTIFDAVPFKVEYYEENYGAIIGLTPDSHGHVVYTIDPDDKDIGVWFEDVVE